MCPTLKHTRRNTVLAILFGGMLALPTWVRAQPVPHPLGLGRTPTAAEIHAWDMAIGPEGKELPPGQGTVAEGASIYLEKCAACHGETGTEGPHDVLVGGQGSLASDTPLKTIGSYWPYATTLYDYLHRAMPFYEPGSLEPAAVYSLTAYLLYLNGIIGEHEVINAQTLPRIRMPNRDGFRPDPRPEEIALPSKHMVHADNSDASASSGTVPHAELGQIHFPTSGTPEAQPHFLTGVLLLHSFEYSDAREAFRQAQRLDPGFALAYWGEALTYLHPLWGYEHRTAAQQALLRLAPTPEDQLSKAPTEREREYLKAVHVLYGKGERESRHRAYADAMRRLSESYPDDLEAASFYALALLGMSYGKRDIPTYMRAAAIAEEVFQRNPAHPGAVHYLIHAYDDPIHAPLGLRAARVYAQIAPSAPHALHMPSHIYLALGMWDEVVTSNEASWTAEEARRLQQQLSVDARGYHALYWLHYGYLQQGRYPEARRLLHIVEEDARQSGSRNTRKYLARMRAQYLIETRAWTDEAVRIQVHTAGLDLSTVGSHLFATGVSALRTGDLATAHNTLSDLRARHRTMAGQGAAQNSPASNGVHDQKVLSIFARELEALIRFEEGEKDKAIQLLQEAVAIEESMNFGYGPPEPVKPAHELFGEMLLDLNRPEEARHQFQLALARAPKRALSLLGLARATARTGDRAAAQQAYTELRAIWKAALAQPG